MLKIEEMVERWNAGKPNLLGKSQAEKEKALRDFCSWNGYNLENITAYFWEYQDQD